MYSIPFPVSAIRTRMRQEFERNRYVNKLSVVDVLILKNNADYQVSVLSGVEIFGHGRVTNGIMSGSGETMMARLHERLEHGLILAIVGNHELLAPDEPHHVLL